MVPECCGHNRAIGVFSVSLSTLLLFDVNRVEINTKSCLNMSSFPPSVVKCDQRIWSVGKKIASGGFGSVFSVNSDGFDSHVVKFIPQVPGAHRELLFPKLADLQNVVPVVDSGESGAHWVIVMPRAEGSLADLLASLDGKLSADIARDILVDIATALVSMKKGRVVHRDIKPDNILLLDGRWCLADFGIFRYAEATTAKDTLKHYWTAPYAAPERWRGERATNATDVYAFGVVAYQLCSGELPFSGPQTHDYRRQHLEELPKPTAEIPTAMASLIDNCLIKSPSARPAPGAILSGLRRSLKPQSAVEGSLQAANARVIRGRLEQSRKESAEQSERERKEDLYRAAGESLKNIVASLAHRIQGSAPSSSVNVDSSFKRLIKLGHATLSVDPVSRADRIVKWGDHKREILAFSQILLRRRPDRDGHKGRSHSLWYYQEEDGGFRWYELAFTEIWGVAHRNSINPFALPPDSPDVGFALRGVVHTINLEKYPCPIDHDNEEDFIGRWMGHFAAGA